MKGNFVKKSLNIHFLSRSLFRQKESRPKTIDAFTIRVFSLRLSGARRLDSDRMKRTSLKNFGTHVSCPCRQSRNNNFNGLNRALVHALQYGNFDIIGTTDRRELIYRETSSLSLSLFLFPDSFKQPMRYKCRSIFTKRGAIHHPRVQLAWPGSLSFFFVLLLFALVVSRAIASPDDGPIQWYRLREPPPDLVSIHLRRNTTR